jgi:hypothetical protein
MDDLELEQPIVVTKSGELLRIVCDGVTVDFTPDGPAPDGAPPLACRIFEALRRDLWSGIRAE